MRRVGVIDYGAGNTHSVLRALQAVGVHPEVIVQSNRHKCREMSHIIFPGVGRARQAKLQIESTGLEEEIRRHVEAGKWLFGICVGMQLLGRFSDEDQTEGLGFLDFKLSHFRELGIKGPVPHMGWNSLKWRASHPLQSCFSSVSGEEKFMYFVHSYAASIRDCEEGSVIAVTELEGLNFVSMVGRDNVVGTQFHVEKSGQMGLDILSRFLEESSKC